MKQVNPVPRLVGWLVLLQAAGDLLIFAAVWTTVGFFESGVLELSACGLGMMTACLLWGFLAPKSARPERGAAILVLAGWAVLTGGLYWFLPDCRALISLPQAAVGTFLASLIPTHYGSALYLYKVRPTAVAVAHILLPVLFWLGMGWRARWEEKR